MDNQTLPPEQNEPSVVKFICPANVVELDKLMRMARDRQRHIDSDRESFRRKLKHMANDAEGMQDYCRRLIREGADVSEELKELECAAHAQLLVVGFLKMEVERG